MRKAAGAHACCVPEQEELEKWPRCYSWLVALAWQEVPHSMCNPLALQASQQLALRQGSYRRGYCSSRTVYTMRWHSDVLPCSI